MFYTRWLVILFSLMLLPILGAQEAQVSSADFSVGNINQYLNKEVTIKGFLFETKEGRWIISSDPHVKSCCLGTRKMFGRQIFIEGLFDSAHFRNNQIIELSGKLEINDNREYILRQVQIKNGKTQSYYFTAIAALVLVGFLGLLQYMRKREHVL